MKSGLENWLVSYIASFFFHRPRQTDGIIDLMFCIADHFEPGWKKADIDEQRKRVDYWIHHYPLFASQFKDSDGYHPQHTWFYSPHEEDEHLSKLTQLCKKGFGEIELHLHHDHIPPVPDNSATLENKISQAVERYAKFGIFGKDKDNSKRCFGFIHGDWALDNSRNGRFCGVNDELRILTRCGCYADFTFPSICESQPEKINSIYYATDDPVKPKSYNTGLDVEIGNNAKGDLMIIEGPLGIRFKKDFPFLAIESANISKSDLPVNSRVNFWVKTGIHVIGKPNWIFIKIHTHGAADHNHDALLGDAACKMHEYLNDKYNDGNKYRLHYVTARQLYNIVKAAEKGKEGNPDSFRDFVVSAPSYG